MQSPSSSSPVPGRDAALPPLQTAAQLLHSLEQRRQRSLLETRIAPFDRLTGGLARGALIELAGGRSSGRFAIALAALAAATRAGESAALVDLGDHLEPRSAEAAGLDLRRLLWVRPRSLKEALMAAEMVLSAGFAVAVLDLGSRPLPLHRVPDSVWVRLARAAETHHNALLLLGPAPVRARASSALITALGGRGVWDGLPAAAGDGGSPPLLSGISSRLTVVRRKGGFAGSPGLPAGEGLPAEAGGLSLGVRDGIGWTGEDA